MRFRTVLPAAVLALAGAAAVVQPLHRAAPPVGHTGGFGEPTCVTCHIGDDINAYGGTLTIDGLPAEYAPGEAYLLTVVLRMEETTVAGFEMAARYREGQMAGRPAGALSSVDHRVHVTVAEGGQPYIHHTEAGTTPADASGSSWAVEWIAPEASDPVTFHVAANSGNGDNSPLADLIFTYEATVPARQQK